MPRISPDHLTPFGSGLHRPEGVAATARGEVFTADWRGGVACVRADGHVDTWMAKDPPIELRPNGVALTRDGGFLIANLSDDGGIWRLDRDGRLTPFLTEVGGRSVPPANFVYIDEQDRTWISVSTRHVPRPLAWRSDVGDGFVVRVEDGRARIVVDGLGYTNEVRTDPTGRWLYVVETFGKRLTRFAIGDPMGPAETVAEFGAGVFPDGFAFDAEGGIWVTSLVSNRVLRIDASGAIEVVIDAGEPGFVAATEQAFQERRMVRDHLGVIPVARFQHITSIAFGGPDLRTAYLGSLHDERLYRFDPGIAGAKPPHWDYPAI
jgi:sugar lactone lactonase YvrE